MSFFIKKKQFCCYCTFTWIVLTQDSFLHYKRSRFFTFSLNKFIPTRICIHKNQIFSEILILIIRMTSLFLLIKSVVHSWILLRKLLRPKSCCRSSFSQIFYRKGVLTNVVKLTRKHMCQSPIFIKVAGWGMEGDSSTGVLLWILRNFSEHLFHRTLTSDGFCSCYLKHQIFEFFFLSSNFSDVYLLIS